MIFFLNTILNLIIPNGYGHHSTFKKKNNVDKLQENKKLFQKFKKTDWINSNSGIKKRKYESDEEYIKHQSNKLEIIKNKGHGWSKKDITEYRLRFWLRFKHLKRFLKKNALCLCLGARQGTEVEVLRELGFSQTFGIDLNPGPENKLVKKGNFMNLDFPDNHFDMLYSNCLDHTLDLDLFFKEQVRVLKNNGYFLIDINTNEVAGSFESQEWDRPELVLIILLKYFRNIVLLKREKRWFWLLVNNPIK